MRALAHLLSTLSARVWSFLSGRAWRTLPRPNPVGQVHAPGVDPDRILVIGSGVSVGYGVLSHELALAGYLARTLAQLTHRGTDVDVVTDELMTARSAVRAVRNPGRYDALVISVGGIEAVGMTPRRSWEHDVRALLTAITLDAPASLRVYLLEIPPLASVLQLPRFAAGAVTKRVVALNSCSREVAEDFDQVTVVPAPEGIAGPDAVRGRPAYSLWATRIAPMMVPGLDLQTAPVPIRVDETERQRALDDLRVVGTTPDERLRQLVATTRNLFDARGASLNLIDRDRQVVLATAGLGEEDSPRSEALCDVTIQRPQITVVPDTALDPVLRERSWAQGPDALRFYAGYPVESPDGYRVGALCVVDSRPRDFTDQDEALLRELALRVQGMLWETSARP